MYVKLHWRIGPGLSVRLEISDKCRHTYPYHSKLVSRSELELERRPLSVPLIHGTASSGVIHSPSSLCHILRCLDSSPGKRTFLQSVYPVSPFESIRILA